MTTLLLATRNRKKAQEFRRLLAGARIRLLTLDQFPDIPPVAENGATFRENAVKKAVTTSRHTILPVVSDDSGLQVRVLRGRPGVRSARFAGPSQKDAANIAKLLRLMRTVPSSRRGARFVCSLALAAGGKLIRTFFGQLRGSIAQHPAGRTGFGYDPVFIPRGSRKTVAQLGSGPKDAFSHRARAARKLKRYLSAHLGC